MADQESTEVEDKIAFFQAITGTEDLNLCTEVLSANDWDLDLAVASFLSTFDEQNPQPPSRRNEDPNASPGVGWKAATSPFNAVSGGVGLVSSIISFGAWVAANALSRSLDQMGIYPQRNDAAASTSTSSSDRLIAPRLDFAAEAADFVEALEFEYGGSVSSKRPKFSEEGFMEALQRAQREFKLLFVYLHSPDHPVTPQFCASCLCTEVVAEFIDANFVSWGGSIRGIEGSKISNSLNASRFPFCAVIMPSSSQGITVLRQIEGPKSPEEMVSTLQYVLEESMPLLASGRILSEERMSNTRLREEQNAAYQAALEADIAREQQRHEEQDQLAREAAEAERKHEEEEAAREQLAHDAIEKEATLARRRQDIATALGAEAEKGLDITQVALRFPSGERKERRFNNSATIKSIYDYVDSLDSFNAENYTLVSNFPRISYGPDKHHMTLKEAGLHPHASLFVEV